MRLFFFVISMCLGIVACGDQQTKAKQEPAKPADTPPAATLPGIPMDIMKNLWDNCDYVDYVFYNLPISMSLNNKASIQNALTHVASDPAPMPPQCKSIGRIFYQIKGENVQMAELYFTPGCLYFVFLGQDEKPAYCNYMTPEGVQYLNNIFSQSGIKAEQIH